MLGFGRKAKVEEPKKFILSKSVDGEVLRPDGVYLVLNLTARDPEHRKAALAAAQRYANKLEKKSGKFPALVLEMRALVERLKGGAG